MPKINRADGTSESFLPQSVVEILAKLLLIAGIVALGAFGYLLFGLFSGQLSEAGQTHDMKAHALQLVQGAGNVLNLSLALALLCGLVLYYEEEALGVVLLVVAGFLAFGLNFLMDFISNGANLTAGAAAQATLKEFHLAAWAIGGVGAAIFLYSIFQRIREMRLGPDLTAVTYGKDAKQEDVPGALIGALAKCWQLPFCREGIRVKCPIFHARTKCWKQRVGCMCEENIIRLAMGGEDHKPIDMTKEGGFVPIGDIITKSEQATRAAIPTKAGPRGVRIPTNPHLSEAQKRHRCHNCVIFNEHQRQKYALFSPLVTIAVPILVFLNFEMLKGWVEQGMMMLDRIMAHLSYTNAPGKPVHMSELTMNVTGSLPLTALLIIVLTMVVMTWALRLLEYCVFKIKI